MLSFSQKSQKIDIEKDSISKYNVANLKCYMIVLASEDLMDNLDLESHGVDITTVITRLEDAKRTTEKGIEYWMARDLRQILAYESWANFLKVIEKAKTAVTLSGSHIENHFADASKMVGIGSDAERSIDDIFLTRYACYLIAMNGSARKVEISTAQTYFAAQTRLQEIQQIKDQNELKNDNEKRLFLRRELAKHNKDLAGAAKGAGVIEPVDYAIFQNFGYKGLYGGLDQKGIHAKKGLKKSQKILDHMGSTELAANLFRATQAEEIIRNDRIKGKQNANETHFKVGQEVRETIKKIGGTMPEDLPTEPHIGKIEKKVELKGLKGREDE
jgi:DNA-damage-inducible protein D